MNYTWICKGCNEIFTTRRLLQSHRKNCKQVKNKTQNHYFECSCQFCNKRYKRKEDKTRHEKYCDKNPNKINKPKGRKHTDREKQHLSKVMKTATKKAWKNRLNRAKLSATQYISKHSKDTNFDIYYSINDSKVKIGISTDYKQRHKMYSKSSNVSKGEYHSIRHFKNVKRAALCEALVTLNFESLNEWYDLNLLEDIIQFIKDIDIKKEIRSDFAKQIF